IGLRRLEGLYAPRHQHHQPFARNAARPGRLLRYRVALVRSVRTIQRAASRLLSRRSCMTLRLPARAALRLAWMKASRNTPDRRSTMVGAGALSMKNDR